PRAGTRWPASVFGGPPHSARSRRCGTSRRNPDARATPPLLTPGVWISWVLAVIMPAFNLFPELPEELPLLRALEDAVKKLRVPESLILVCVKAKLLGDLDADDVGQVQKPVGERPGCVRCIHFDHGCTS